MSPLFTKLNVKDCREILVVDAPPEFAAELALLEGVCIRRDPNDVRAFAFAPVFSSKQAEVDRLSAMLVLKAKSDALSWFAYPNKGDPQMDNDLGPRLTGRMPRTKASERRPERVEWRHRVASVPA